MIRIYINPIVEMLSVGVVTYREMAAYTGLSKTTCFRVMHDLTGAFNEDTALMVTRWYVEYIDSTATLETLFHEENLRTEGKKPFATTLNKAPRDRSVTCGSCFTKTPSHLSECANCDEPLPVLVSA